MKAPFPDYARRPAEVVAEPKRKYRSGHENRLLAIARDRDRILRVNAPLTQSFVIQPTFPRPAQGASTTGSGPANAATLRGMDLWARPIYNPAEHAWPTPRPGSTAPFDIPSRGDR